MKNKKSLEVFNKYVSRTKEEIIKEFEDYYNYFKTDEEEIESMSKEYRKCFYNLCENFLNKLKEIDIPKLTDDWWYYSFYVHKDRIVLDLELCDDIEIDEDEVSEMTSTSEFELLNVKCNYLTVNEYAKLYSVSDITVRQWIRRGKIRSAKKNGREWLIPELVDKPSRGFIPVQYFFNDDIPLFLIEKYLFLKNAKSMFIDKNKEDSGLYNVYIRYDDKKNPELEKVSNKRRENLEIDLISSGVIKDFQEW